MFGSNYLYLAGYLSCWMYCAFIDQRKRKKSASNENDSDDDEDSKPLVSFGFSSELINLQQVIQVCCLFIVENIWREALPPEVCGHKCKWH